MADDKQTGPRILALGMLAISAGAVILELLRQRRTDGDEDVLRGGE